MTMRELVKEVMIANGHTEEEIAERNKFASSVIPGLPVDKDFPPEMVEPMRQHLKRLYAACQDNPTAHVEWARQKTAELVKKN